MFISLRTLNQPFYAYVVCKCIQDIVKAYPPIRLLTLTGSYNVELVDYVSEAKKYEVYSFKDVFFHYFHEEKLKFYVLSFLAFFVASLFYLLYTLSVIHLSFVLPFILVSIPFFFTASFLLANDLLHSIHDFRQLNKIKKKR